ncbi:MAG: thermonuclease family protein [Thermomicrobiales bacterium]
MRRIVAAFAVLVSLLSLPTAPHAVAQAPDCSAYDSWIWAQTELAPQSSDKVCDTLPPGFAPAFWTDAIPTGAEQATFVSMTDGDTLTVTVNGQQDTVRLYRADAPEYQACGGSSATAFANQVMGYNSEGTAIYLEYDATKRDRYDRRLAYVWLNIDGHPYMLNEALIRSGYAQDKDYGDRLYSSQFGESKAFAKRWDLGVYAECGGFGLVTTDSGSSGSGQPAPTEVPSGPGAGTCDPSYPTVCISPIEVSGDLDCGDITYRRFQVLPPDPHGFDGDHDGIGCEGKR